MTMQSDGSVMTSGRLTMTLIGQAMHGDRLTMISDQGYNAIGQSCKVKSRRRYGSRHFAK